MHPGRAKLDLAEHRYIGRMSGDIFELELHLALPQHGGLVWRDEADRFREVANASGPPVEDCELQRDHGQLGHAQKIDDADEKEVSGRFLPDFFADKRALEVGQNSGGLHSIYLRIQRAVSAQGPFGGATSDEITRGH